MWNNQADQSSASNPFSSDQQALGSAPAVRGQPSGAALTPALGAADAPGGAAVGGGGAADQPSAQNKAAPFSHYADEQPDKFGHGQTAAPLESGLRAKAERSLGVDLGGVKVFHGTMAGHAAAKLGTRAFAHGQNIVLGHGVENALNPVMAHELAHTVQQRGAQPAPANFAERGEVGGLHERDAVNASTAIMLGVPTRVQAMGTERVHGFEGAEHLELGNAGFGGRNVTVGQVTLPAGAFTAMMGDFYTSFDTMQLDCQTNPRAVYGFYDVLLREGRLRDAHQRDPAHNPEPDSNGAILLAEKRNGSRTDYLGASAQNFNHFGDNSPASQAQFMKVAKDNPQYAAEVNQARGVFGANIAQYLEMHLRAARTAFDDALAGRPTNGVGVAMDASACHFLTDAFAAGHMRTPRAAMYSEYQQVFKQKGRARVEAIVNTIPASVDVLAILGGGMMAMMPGAVRPPPISLIPVRDAVRRRLTPKMDAAMASVAEKIAGFGAKVLHDQDNAAGLQVHNQAGQGWHATGDHALAASDQNLQIATRCVGASAAHIDRVAKAGHDQASRAAGQAPMMPFVSLKPITSLLPIVDKSETKPAEEAPGGRRDWHWQTASPAFKHQILANFKDSVTGTVSSVASAVGDVVREEVEAKIQQALSSLGAVGSYVASHVGALVSWVMNHLPAIDPEWIMNGILE